MVNRYQLSYRLKAAAETAGYVRIGIAVVQDTELGNDCVRRALMLAAHSCMIAESTEKAVATTE